MVLQMCGNLRAVQLDEIICMLDGWISRSVQSVVTGRWKAEPRQDGRMVTCGPTASLLPPPCPPHGYFINIIMSWILKDFSQQENRGLLCHDLAIYTLPLLCHYSAHRHGRILFSGAN